MLSQAQTTKTKAKIMLEPKITVEDKKLAPALVVTDAPAPVAPAEPDVAEDDEDEAPKVNPFAQFMGCAP